MQYFGLKDITVIKILSSFSHFREILHGELTLLMQETDMQL